MWAKKKRIEKNEKNTEKNPEAFSDQEDMQFFFVTYSMRVDEESLKNWLRNAFILLYTNITLINVSLREMLTNTNLDYK